MAHHFHSKTGNLSVPRFTFAHATQSMPKHRDMDLVRHKYIEAGLSTAKIAEELGCARSTVSEALRKSGISAPERPKVQTVPGRGLAFGFAASGGRLVPNVEEATAILQIKELRKSGMSYWKIAAELNRQGVPTKTKRSGWKAATVMGIAKRWTQSL